MLTSEDEDEVDLDCVETILLEHEREAVDRLYDDLGDVVHDWIEYYCMDSDGNLSIRDEDSLEIISWDAAEHACKKNETIRTRLNEVCEDDGHMDIAKGYLGQRGVNNGGSH